MNVLIITAHPDDETLGCGGTLLKHRYNGDTLYWLIVTEVSESIGYSSSFISARKNQIALVAQHYNFRHVYQLHLPTTQLHLIDFSNIVQNISHILQDIRPEIIYTVNRSDIHTDHQITSKATMSASKHFRNTFIKRILMYECISETEVAPAFPENIFLPNVYIDIENFLDEKINIMNIYSSELQSPPLPRSIENITSLARFRGSSVALNYAEAFMLVREVA